MNVCVAVEERFLRLPDGSVWTRNQYVSSFWRRYLTVFDHVTCLARVRDVGSLDSACQPAGAAGVSFAALPHYVGPLDFVRQATRVRRAVRQAIRPEDAFVLRVPGTIGDLAAARLQATGHPFGVEVLGDAYEVFSPGAVRHPLRGFFRWHATRQLRRQCARACAASYVTARALQQRYPTTAPSVAASSIELDDRLFVEQPRWFAQTPRPATLLFVGSLEQDDKGPDLLIRAAARLLERGIDLRVTVVGDGRVRPELERLAGALGCGARVRFAGRLSGDAVRQALDAADLFVLPSRTEGLPRAMVEAMARGVPCIGSAAGGIPELLPSEDIVPCGDAERLAEVIAAVLADPVRMHRMSRANIQAAKAYRKPLLDERRTTFYRLVRDATEAWLHERRAA